MSGVQKVVMFTAVVRNFTPKKGETPKLDINDKPPMVVEAIGGTSPRPINLISGTVAEGQDLKAGHHYIFKAVHTGLVESTVNEGEMIDGFNLSAIGEIDVERAIDWYERKGLHFEVDPEMENERVSNMGAASQERKAGEVKARRERDLESKKARALATAEAGGEEQKEPEEEV